MDLINSELIYSIAVTLITFVIYFIGQHHLVRKKTKRLKRAKKKTIFDSMGTGETPSEIDDQEIQQLGIESIKGRFLFIQRLYPIFIFFLWFALVIIPYLSKIPVIYVSLIVAFITLIFGVAVRPFVENIIGGVVISLFQPVRVGDTVRIDGHYGTIEQINLTHCVLRVWDWKRYVIPNSKMLSKEIQNHTMHDNFIWTHISFYVAPESDLDMVEKLCFEAASESPYRVDGEKPTFWVTALEKDAIECWLAVWAPNPSDAWDLRCDMRKKLHTKLKLNKIMFQNIRHNSH